MLIETDTVKLLKECDAGLRMGADSIGEVLDYVEDKELQKKLMLGKSEHEKLISEVERELADEGSGGKEPNTMAKSMSWMKTNVKMAADFSDSTVADLIYDGCYMGMKSLHRYKNQYCGATEKANELCDRIIRLEADLAEDMRIYL
ncbi:MAG: hypothetical protein E7578_01030 [Ruminococcaceae bacterium]|nr:hypothetical protein [Oscillospiraceae bacterium]